MQTLSSILVLILSFQAQALVTKNKSQGFSKSPFKYYKAPKKQNQRNSPSQTLPRNGTLNCQGGVKDSHSAAECEVINLVNKKRARKRLRLLQPSRLCHKASKDHAKDVTRNLSRYTEYHFKNHINLRGEDISARARNAGLEGQYMTLAENTAQGQRTPQKVVTAWMNSKGHRENILNPKLTHIGVALETGRDRRGNLTKFWVQCFIQSTGNRQMGTLEVNHSQASVEL